MHKIFIFFSILLFTPIQIEPSIFSPTEQELHIYVSYGCHQTDNESYETPTSHADYSYNNTEYHSRVGSSYHHRPRFKTYTANEFRDYFTARRYTEQEILNQRHLYKYDEFVKCAQTYPNYKNAIQQLHAELKKFGGLQKLCYWFTGSYCRKLQERIQFLYNQLSTIKNEEPTNKNIIWRDYSIEAFSQHRAECSTLDSTYRTYTPSLANALDKRIDAYNSMFSADYALQHATKSYNLNNNVKQLLDKYGHDTTCFTQCFGNELRHAIHQESLNLLDRIDHLPSNSLLYDHQEALVDFTVAMANYNHENLTDKAMNIADFCWTLLDYGQAIAEGAALGAYSAVTDIFHNPIEATINIVAGKQVLAYQLSKVLYNVADIGITALSNLDHAKDKWNKYAEPLNNIIDAINKKEIKLRDAVKGGTAFVVGYKTQGKLLGGLGKLCNTIKQKSINFAKNCSVFNPEDYLTTPEGLLFKSTINSNKLKQSGQTTTASLKNTVDNKIIKNKSIKRLIKQESLPTKGKLRYVPPKKLHSFDRLPYEKLSNGDIGFIDRFGNLWVGGKSRTKGQPFEWDVQLSQRGIQQVGWMTRDNSHLNVSLDGRVTHK